MKKIFAIGLIIVILILGASFLIVHPITTGDDVNKSQETIEFSENGVNLLIPGDWVSAKSNSNSSILAVADSNTKDSAGFNSINLNVEKKSTYNSLDYEFKSNYNRLSRNSAYEILYEGNVTIEGTQGMEVGYTSSDTGYLKQHKAIWFKKDSDIYVILCTAPESKWAEEESTFDFIINNMQFN